MPEHEKVIRNHRTAMQRGGEAAAELDKVLRGIGIVLPSIQGDFPVGDRPMVKLGSCNAETALLLAQWIRERS